VHTISQRRVGDLAPSRLGQALGKVPPAGSPTANKHADLRISMY
jgi:hypothetical protein